MNPELTGALHWFPFVSGSDVTFRERTLYILHHARYSPMF